MSPGERKAATDTKISPSAVATMIRTQAKRTDCSASSPYTPTATIAVSTAIAKVATGPMRVVIGVIAMPICQARSTQLISAAQTSSTTSTSPSSSTAWGT